MKSKKIIAGIMAVMLVLGSAVSTGGIAVFNDTAITASAENREKGDLLLQNKISEMNYDEAIEFIEDESNKPLYDYEYKTLEDGNVELTRITNKAEDVDQAETFKNIVIPSEIDGKTVSKIGKELFSGCIFLTNLTIPDGIVSIGDRAFKTANIKTLNIPSSVKSIGAESFHFCQSLELLTLPEGLEEIGYEAFIGCAELKSVTIPKSVTKIGENAFGYISITGETKTDKFKIYCYANTAGEQYAIDNGFDYELLDEPIDEESSVTVPESSVTDTDSPAPINSSTTDATDFKHSEVTDGIEITDNTITSDTVKIPESIDGKNVVSVGGWAFAGMEITSVELPSVLKSIGEYAFFNCPALTSITVPKNVENIGDYALGYYLDENAVSGSSTVTLAGAMSIDTNKIKKIDGFKIYCYAGTAGEKYAVDNGFDYVLLDNSDSDTTTSSKSEATSTSNKTNNSSTANPSTGAAAGLALAAVGLGAVVVTKRRK